MAYCRWSSMNWRCDLYCYEDVSGGWTTHVAGRRRVGEIPDDRFADFVAKKITVEEYMALHRAQMDALEKTQLVDIDLPHAGETFSDPTLEAFKDRLLYLRGVGYVFPDHVLEEIDAEMKEAG
jgi:hypothetical protein